MFNIFYSWQSDVDTKANRSFIRKAVEKSIAAVIKDYDIASADRPQVVSDTQGEQGLAPIVDTIFGKIRNAKVVVLDVTLTGSSEAQALSQPEGAQHKAKRTLNSNVAIELGYAHAVHGYEPLLCIMNSFFGDPTDLPFDLQHCRWPIQYHLDPDADPQVKSKVLDKLVAELKPILSGYVGRWSGANQPFQRYKPNSEKGAFWTTGHSILHRKDPSNFEAETAMRYRKRQSRLYLRMWPPTELGTSFAERESDFRRTDPVLLCAEDSSISYGQNRFGWIKFSNNSADILNLTQCFYEGEIWGVSSSLLYERKGISLLDATELEKRLRSSFRSFCRFAVDSLGYKETINFEVGLANAESTKLYIEHQGKNRLGAPIFDSVSDIGRWPVERVDQCEHALLPFFEKIFQKSGENRPLGFNGFPNLP